VTLPRPSLPSMLVKAMARVGVHCRMSPEVDKSDLDDHERLRRPRLGVVLVARGGERFDEDATGEGEHVTPADATAGAHAERPAGVVGVAIYVSGTDSPVGSAMDDDV